MSEPTPTKSAAYEPSLKSKVTLWIVMFFIFGGGSLLSVFAYGLMTGRPLFPLLEQSPPRPKLSCNENVIDAAKNSLSKQYKIPVSDIRIDGVTTLKPTEENRLVCNANLTVKIGGNSESRIIEITSSVADNGNDLLVVVRLIQ
ncbi:hypothetical protein [Roseixanthobacter liquoris]|uniref:hypothetical protein n=1 Tax=Roseixanthobacter liquoris TaxID=3119921 RepID=UPI0037283DEE